MMHTSASQDASPAPPGSSALEAGVFCPRCKRSSLDKSFCEHCQFELPSSMADSTTSVSFVVPGSNWSLESFGVSWPDDPRPCFVVKLAESSFRVRAIRPELWPDFADDVRVRQSVKLRALPPINVLEIGNGSLVFAETWEPVRVGLRDQKVQTLDDLLVDTMQRCRVLDTAMMDLHSSEHVWLEFDPEAVEVNGEQPRITNMDWRLFPFGLCPKRLARISPKYSPPEVCQFRDEFIGPRTDVFHLALFAYYRLAGLEKDGIAGRGLESFGFEIPSLRLFRPDLPAGIWPVLHRALSKKSNHRPASTGEIIQQLAAVIERPTRRRLPLRQLNEWMQLEPVEPWELMCNAKDEPGLESSSKPQRSIVVDVASQTIAGRAKSSIGAVNQDCVVVQRVPIGDRQILLMIVADGVSHANVGTGDRASTLACETLAASIRQQISNDSLPEWSSVLFHACQSASEAIVSDALAIPNRPAMISDNDLMSSTALIGILDGRDLYLANVGDSRAYLVANGIAEQLTIDGDVASTQLVMGTPPEQVQELGTAGKALRFCLGACREIDGGQLVAEYERARPQISRWQTNPGDLYVLCTDGLVEEQVFLEPEDLGRIVNEYRNLTSQELVRLLVDAANDLQRLPSETEPNGYGDNITCIILRMVEDHPSHNTLTREG